MGDSDISHPFIVFLKRLRAAISPPPQAMPPLQCADDALAQFERSERPAGCRPVDDQTWKDLELGRLLATIAQGCSVFGQQVLHQRLRHGRLPPAAAGPGHPDRAGDEGLDRELADGALAPLAQSLAPGLGRLRAVDTDVTDLLFGPARAVPPGWIRWLWVVPVALFTSVALLKFTLLAWWTLLAAVFASGLAQVRLYRPLMQWQRERRALLALLACAQSWVEQRRTQPHPLLDGFDERLRCAELARRLKPKLFHGGGPVSEYTNLVALSEYREMARQWRTLDEVRPALREIFRRVGTVEALLAFAAHLRARSVWCRAQFATGRRIRFTGLCNPLLPDGRAIDQLQADQGGLIVTGQNGAGKSTLLRSIGLNMVLARAFGHCHAAGAELPDAPVLSSLQIEDSLQSGDSFYVAELKRARQLIEAAAAPGGAVVLIDEIFRGTNHLESVAAAAAVLHELAERAMVVVSSHHLELVPLLQELLAPVRVLRSPADPDQVLVEPGVLAETNGLRLLGACGVPDPVVQRARAVADWLATHMVEPVAAADRRAFTGLTTGR